MPTEIRQQTAQPSSAPPTPTNPIIQTRDERVMDFRLTPCELEARLPELAHRRCLIQSISQAPLYWNSPLEGHTHREEACIYNGEDAWHLSRSNNVMYEFLVQPPPQFNEREADFDVDYTTALSRPDLHHRRCLFKNDIGYWGPNYQGYLPREEAAIYTIGDALRNSLRYTTFEILKDKPSPPGCKMEDRFTLNFIETLKLSPNNPTLRAHMMRNLKIMPPGELDTFEKLKEWVEKNFPPLPQMMASAPTRQPTARRPELELTYLVSDTERGRAYYSVGRSGMTNNRVSLAELEEWINEDIDMADLIQRLQEDAADTNDDGDLPWDGDPEYTEYEPDDNSNYSCVAEGGDAAVETNVRNFLESHAPHLLERLNNH